MSPMHIKSTPYYNVYTCNILAFTDNPEKNNSSSITNYSIVELYAAHNLLILSSQLKTK